MKKRTGRYTFGGEILGLLPVAMADGFGLLGRSSKILNAAAVTKLVKRAIKCGSYYLGYLTSIENWG